MTVAAQPHNRYLERPSPSSLADVIDTILDKGLVIDIYVRVRMSRGGWLQLDIEQPDR
jgi:gas vesicle structural protein